MTSRLAAIIPALKAILFTPIACLGFITTAAAVTSLIWLLTSRPRHPPAMAEFGRETSELALCA
jgi:hypothetical protein